MGWFYYIRTIKYLESGIYMVECKEVSCQSIITKSKLPDADFVINPYIGCPHKCIYCYAEFMKRFSRHKGEWGEFLDIKSCDRPIPIKKLENKKVLISSVTDSYNPFEKKYEKTRAILLQLVSSGAKVEILTKSSLVCRDIDIFKRLKNIRVGISINTLDDNFRRETEPRAGTIKDRLSAFQILKNAGIPTYAFISPIFPGITDLESLVREIGSNADYFYFENLNLRGSYKARVMKYIENTRPELKNLYDAIYTQGQAVPYWDHKLAEIARIFSGLDYPYKTYFYHTSIRKN